MIALSESKKRLYEKLHHDLGEDIVLYLQDKNVNEILLNPDGKLWVDCVERGLTQVSTLSEHNAYAIINAVAGLHNFVVTQYYPSLEAELPVYKSMRGERFTAQIPPMVSRPSFTIRKKSEMVFTLDDYVTTNRLTPRQQVVLKKLIKERSNILVCGGPGSGKTTVANALIIEAVASDENQRFIILEDLPELQCEAPNKVCMVTTDNISLTGLLRTAMRMRPDRILIGEVRGREALDMLKAWNTGCPGGICTVHANSAADALQRILDLAMEASLTTPPVSLVSHTIDAVVSVVRQNNQKGFIHEILAVGEYKDGKFAFEKLA